MVFGPVNVRGQLMERVAFTAGLALRLPLSHLTRWFLRRVGLALLACGRCFLVGIMLCMMGLVTLSAMCVLKVVTAITPALRWVRARVSGLMLPTKRQLRFGFGRDSFL